jgi:proteasome accessory factor C
MPKRITSNLAQTERLLNLVPYLTTHQNISLDDLSKEFSVSKKEILDDLNTLWMCGLPGYTPLELIDLTFDEGYVSIRNAEILETPRSLTTNEVIALILGLDLIAKSVNNFQEEIRNLQSRLREITGDIVRALPSIDSAYRGLIAQAISERKNLTVTYFSLVSDKVSTREVTPLEIQPDGSIEYLVAMTDEGLRNFRLDRVSNITLSETNDSKTIQLTSIESAEIKVQLRILRNFRSMMEAFNIDATDNSQTSDEVHEVLGFSSEWFVRSTMSGAGAVEVITPVEMRVDIASLATQLLNIYESSALPK